MRVSFGGVSKLGLATLPAVPSMSFYDTTMNYVLAGVGCLSSLALAIGAVMMLGSMGRNGMTLFLLGVIMAVIGSLTGNGGFITLIMHGIGVSVPVLA